MSVEEGPKETFADTKLCEARSSEEEPNKAQRNPLNINIDFSQWLEALFIALKYRRGISKEPSQPPNSGESQPEDTEPEPESLPTLTRFYTCPLDQVVEELDQLHHDGASFSRLYMVEEGCELSFNFHQILRSGRVQLWRAESDPLAQSEVDIDLGGGGRAEPLPHGRRHLLPSRLSHLLLAQPLQWGGPCAPPLLQYSRPAHLQACPARPHDPAAGLLALLAHMTQRGLQNSPSQRLPLCTGPAASGQR